MKQRIIDILLAFGRVIFGITFLFSGFVKAVDPMGSAYKFMEYFRAFELTSLNSLAIVLAVTLAAVEFTIGASILFGTFRKLSTTLALLFMLFFTPLTLYMAIANPVSDCGCFGDAIQLTNWQTLYKNILLLLIAVALYLKKSELTPWFIPATRWIPSSYALFFSVALSAIALIDLPILDFRPFKSGINIAEAMQVSADAPPTQYLLIYEKEGLKKEFTLENYPADDESWVFVESKTIAPGEIWQPAIKDLTILNEAGENVTHELLSDPEYSFLLLAADLESADDSYIDHINEIYEYALEFNYKFYCITVNDKEAVNNWIESTGAEYPFLYCDAKVIETIERPNPTMMLLKEGVIYWKKNTRNLPDESELTEPLLALSLGEIKKNNSNNIILSCLFAFFAPIILLLLFEKSITNLIKKRKEHKEKLTNTKQK